MADPARQKTIKVIGLYVVIILALARFLIYPLNAAVAGKKTSLVEQYENYKLKYRLVERQKTDQDSRAAVDKTVLFTQLYEKGVGYSLIQADIIEQVTKFAEKKGMTVLNYEMPEPAIGKNVSEVPVIIRLQMKPLNIIETFEMIKKGKRILRIKSTDISMSGQDLQLSLNLSAFRVEK